MLMARYRTGSIEFKRHVVQEYLDGEVSLLGQARRHLGLKADPPGRRFALISDGAAGSAVFKAMLYLRVRL